MSDAASVVREIWRAVADSDVERMRGCCHEDMVWHGTGRSIWGGDHPSRRAALEFLIEVGDQVDDLRSDLESLIAADDEAVAILRMNARRGEKLLDTRLALIFRLRDGKVSEVTSVAFDQYATDAFFA